MKYPITEFNRIFESLEPEIRSDLERLDHRLRNIFTDARLHGVPKRIIEDQTRIKIIELIESIARGEVSMKARNSLFPDSLSIGTGRGLTKAEREELRKANEPVPRPITLEEWNRYWPDEPYPKEFAKPTTRRANKHTIKRRREKVTG